MGDLTQTWAALSPARRIILLAAAAGTVALVLLMAGMASKPQMALLYAGLDNRAAGETVAQLEQMGVVTEIRGGAIYVPEGERDRARLALAKEGLPQRGPQGYELLDQLTGFGTTAEMFDAAYWRAKEGELARTLLAAEGVRQARVHISAGARRPFSRDDRGATASVTLRGVGGRVTPQTAMAARYMVALAVPGLEPGQVAVIDAVNGVVLRPGEEGANGAVAGENDRAARIKRDIEALVAARAGHGRARVSVHVETVRESASVSRRLIDPESRALRRNETTSNSESGTGPAGVTVASNLPDGEGAGEGSSNESSESRETSQYDYSETREERVTPGGAIRRIGVAILLDAIRTPQADGTMIETPRADTEIAALESLVKSAIGFDEARGDTVTIQSMSFAEAPEAGVEAAADLAPGFLQQNLMTLIQTGALALVALALGLFVVRPVLMAGRAGGDDGGGDMIDVTPAMGGLPNFGGGGMADFDAMSAAAFGQDDEGGMSGGAGGSGEGSGDAVEELRALVGERADESAELLKSWLDPSDAAPEAAEPETTR